MLEGQESWKTLRLNSQCKSAWALCLQDLVAPDFQIFPWKRSLIGVELSSLQRVPVTAAQISFLPGLLGPLHSILQKYTLKTLAVWRGLLSPPELLFSLRVRSVHSCKSVKQHHTPADLCAQSRALIMNKEDISKAHPGAGPLPKINSTPEVHNDKMHCLSKGPSTKRCTRPYGDNQTSLQGC